jgi:[pyruvate, water dikinase]-phosphate phosphotransferase / [pyruvate, water dikinase] kinase
MGLKLLAELQKQILPQPSFRSRMITNYEEDSMRKLTLFIVSDSVGETADLVAKAAASQFRQGLETVSIKRFSHIEEESQLDEIVYLAKQLNAIIIYTLVKSAMCQKLTEQCESKVIQCIDLLGPLIKRIGTELGEKPLEEPGLVRKLDEDYFKKIEAIEFAVKYDDGRDPRGVLRADIVLVGISRTSKTPLSQYLAHKGFKVANIPLVPEVEPPEELYRIDPAKCFGLVISPEKLNSIRRERLIALGLKDDANYAQVKRIEAEIAHFNNVVSKIDCTVIDVTNRAVEETANVILSEITNRIR